MSHRRRLMVAAAAAILLVLAAGYGAYRQLPWARGPARHADPRTALRYYVKVIPDNQRKAVADVMKKRAKRRSNAEPNR